MTAAFEVIKSLPLAALRFGIAYALFFYLAHFTVPQSIVLAIVGLIAFDAYRLSLKVPEKQPPQFEPFWISIEPNWYALSKDFGLTDVEKWQELQKTCDGASSKYSVLRDGIAFTVLSPNLFYSNNHQCFFGELDIREEVTEMTPPVPERYMLRPLAPRFYAKRSLGGPKENIPVFEFGLVTQESLKRRKRPGDHEEDMVVARLPEIVFYHYYNSDDYDIERARRIEAKAKADLTEFGWKEKERDPEDSWRHWPYEIDHQYLRVVYRGIS
jgi:hypothetical protein